MLRNKPIQSKLMAVILMTSAVVLIVTCTAYFFYEYYSFRRTTVYQLSVISKMIASNSSAALAFQNVDDANEVLSALQAEPHIRAGALYLEDGKLFAKYYSKDSILTVPSTLPLWDGFRFENNLVVGIQPILHDGRRMGTLYLLSDLDAIYDRFALYALIAGGVVVISFFTAYIMSSLLQKRLSEPILDLADTAKAISENADYSVRAKKYDNDEVGLLTDAFNKMLVTIESQNQEILKQNSEITSLNQSLEIKVADRTKDLEQAYKEMEAFSYTVSHDLNAPLRHIDSFLNMFLKKYSDTIDEPGRKTLNTVSRNARKMRELINDLLAFSQLGRQELKRTRVNTLQLVTEICNDHKSLQGGRNIQIEIRDLPDCTADESTLRQAWENLISNSIKYSQNKPDTQIKIFANEFADTITYNIQDNGVGFDMNDYEKLFNPFQRLHSSSEFEGTGVGLAIVHRIITKHGGCITAKSVLNEGSTFSFTLPKL